MFFFFLSLCRKHAILHYKIFNPTLGQNGINPTAGLHINPHAHVLPKTMGCFISLLGHI